MSLVIKTRLARAMLVMAIPAVAIFAVATWAGAAWLSRLVSDFQTGEITSLTAPAAGGTGGSHVYTKAVRIPFPVVFITFTGTGDTHGGAALLMSGSVTNPAGVTQVCASPIVSGGAANTSGWITLQKLPAGTGGTNCNDGGGGDGDCHDNNLVFSCCVLTTPGGVGTLHTIDLRLASSNGAIVFYERANIQVDGSPNPGGKLCQGPVAVPADYVP